tara:strand:+ start:61 stop:261 length:201 start_codon:yes stop_codon:yes gene_type:complete
MSVVFSEAGKSGSTFSIISLASSQRQQSFLVRISICILIFKTTHSTLLGGGRSEALMDMDAESYLL